MNSNYTRYEKRKKQRINLWLNVSIGIVVLLILYVAVQILLGPKSEEEAISDEGFEETTEPVNEEDFAIEDDEEPSIEYDVNREEEEELSLDDEQTESELDETEPSEIDSGEWQPIGTVQAEPFEASFDRDSINWREMTEALQYATGLHSEDMIIWRLGNGGDLQSAIGIVSTYEEKDTPYEVRLEWVTEKGWKPVSVTKLTENPTGS